MGGDTYRALLEGENIAGQTLGGVAALGGKLGSYQALSNALFPETTQAWIEATNNEFMNTWADLPAFFSQGICEDDDYKRAESPGASSAFVRTQSGTYQFVGQIQAEKSNVQTEVLCEINEEDEPYCAENQVCVNDFCYPDIDLDEEPDTDVPVKGKYYKIYWGVTAPQDEAHTPFVDENGKAVKFNVQLLGTEPVWLYKRKGATGSKVVALENGESDSGLIVRFLDKDYTRVCIYFDPDYRVTDYWKDPVKEICTDFINVGKGKVEAGGSGSGSITSSSPGVELNI